MRKKDNHDKPRFWGYGQDDGDLVRVEVVPLPPDAQAALRRLYQEPTNLSEIGIDDKCSGS